jgi:hypothetical protein
MKKLNILVLAVAAILFIGCSQQKITGVYKCVGNCQQAQFSFNGSEVTASGGMTMDYAVRGNHIYMKDSSMILFKIVDADTLEGGNLNPGTYKKAK